MKKTIIQLAFLAVLLANPCRGDDLPYFSSLREEVLNQLTIASNNPPVDKKIAKALGSSLGLINKTLPTYINGSAALGVLSKNLGKTSLSNTFLPIIMDVRMAYLEGMESEKELLESRLAGTIPGKTQLKAQAAIDKFAVVLENATTNEVLALSLKSLSKAAKELAKATSAVAKAETASPGANFFTATITESGQAPATFVPSKGGLEAYYDPFFGELYIDAAAFKPLGGDLTEVWGISLMALVSDSGAYSLSLTNDTEGTAFYAHGIVRDINSDEPEIESQEVYYTIDPFNERFGTGTLNITVNLEANVVWGTVTFSATGSENSENEAMVTGSFLVRIETLE